MTLRSPFVYTLATPNRSFTVQITDFTEMKFTCVVTLYEQVGTDVSSLLE